MPDDHRTTALRTTPVKGLALRSRTELMLGLTGAADNRCFFLIDAGGKLVNGKRVGILSAVVADYDVSSGRLTMSFPDGTVVSEIVSLAEPVRTRFFARTPTAQLVTGPWSQALSGYAGQPLRLVRFDPAGTAVDRGTAGSVSLISRASVTHLEGLTDGRTVDARRFRMLVEVDGPQAHEEDGWVGQSVRIGEALVTFHGHVGRCLVTSQDPDSGLVDLPTLELLGYRRGLDTTEPLAFGIYGEVIEPGIVRLGDTVSPHRSWPPRQVRATDGPLRPARNE